MQVFKFGGASVKDADSVKNVASILQKHANQSTIVVISAMGKTTNKLEQLVNAYFYKDGDIETILAELKTYHLSILNQLIPNKANSIYNDIENVFVELLWAIEEETSGSYNYHYDQLVSQGEVLATKIVSAYLNEVEIKKQLQKLSFVKMCTPLQCQAHFGERRPRADRQSRRRTVFS